MINQSVLRNVKASWDGKGAMKIKNALNKYLISNKATADKLLDKYKALDTQTSTEGAELVDTILFRGIMEKIDVFGNVAPQFPQIAMPSAVYEIPVEISQAIVTLQAENTGSTGQTSASSTTPTTNKAILTAQKFSGKTWVSTELEEDSVIDIVSYIINSHAEGQAYAMDDAILNGDADGTHQDSDVDGAGRDARVAFNGLRKLALGGSLSVNAGGDAFAMADAFDAEQVLGKYASNRQDLVWFVSPKTYLQMVEVAAGTSNNNMISFNVSNGFQLLTLNGVRVIQSDAIKTNYNASGVYDGVTTTRTYAVLVNTRRFMVGTRAELSFQSDRNYDYDQDELFSRVRKAFSPLVTPSATESSVAIVYNIL